MLFQRAFQKKAFSVSYRNIARLTGLLFLILSTQSCSWVVGDHPFSSLPGPSGKLDKTPEVLILRGQAPEVCRSNEETFWLYYFVVLRNMPVQELFVEDGDSEKRLYGQHFTIKARARGHIGKLAYTETKFRLNHKSYDITTVIYMCPTPDTISSGAQWY